MVLLGGFSLDSTSLLAGALFLYAITYHYAPIRKLYRAFAFRLVINIIGVYAIWYLFTTEIYHSFTTQYLGIMTRATDISSGHAAIWALYGIFLVVVQFAPFDDIDIIRAMIMMLGLLGEHETIWYVAYFISNPEFLVQDIRYYSPFIMLVIALWLLMAWRYPEFNKLVIRQWGWLWLAFFALWIWSGFPITLDLKIGALSVWYNVPAVSMIEVFSWVLFTICPLYTYLFAYNGEKTSTYLREYAQDEYRSKGRYGRTRIDTDIRGGYPVDSHGRTVAHLRTGARGGGRMEAGAGSTVHRALSVVHNVAEKGTGQARMRRGNAHGKGRRQRDNLRVRVPTQARDRSQGEVIFPRFPFFLKSQKS